MLYDGFVEIAERLVPYRYIDGKIIIYFGLNPVSLPDGIDTLETRCIGCLTSKSTLFKLTMPLQNSRTLQENGEAIDIVAFNHKCDVEFSVEDYDDGAVYTEVRFDSRSWIIFAPLRICVISKRERQKLLCLLFIH